MPQDLLDLRKAVENALPPENVVAVGMKELERLEKTDPSAAEYPIGLNYLDYLLSLPWSRYTDDNLDVERAERGLEAEHYGLAHLKERVLEYLAVLTLRSMKTFQVLVVDDEEIARANVEHVVAKLGHRVETAANGLEAVQAIGKRQFDLVITDLRMEKLDGQQLLESIERVAPNTDIIMVTGYATIDSAVDALTKGAAYYLTKAQMKKIKTGVQHFRYLSHEEMETLLDACQQSPNRQLYVFVVTALNTGMRLGELTALEWKDLDFKRGTMRVDNREDHHTKNYEPRTIPMNDQLIALLSNHPRRLDSPYVFARKSGEKFRKMRTSFENALRRAGIAHVRFHDLRHTFISHLVMGGVDILHRAGTARPQRHTGDLAIRSVGF